MVLIYISTLEILPSPEGFLFNYTYLQICLRTLYRHSLSTYIISVLTKTYIDMEMNEDFLDACKGLVMHCNCNILILDVMGDYRVYIAPEVLLKTRECRYNEVRDAQDITKLILNLGHNFAQGMNAQVLRERTQSVHKESFKFGTDNYLWFTKVDLNR